MSGSGVADSCSGRSQPRSVTDLRPSVGNLAGHLTAIKSTLACLVDFDDDVALLGWCGRSSMAAEMTVEAVG